MSDGDIRPNEPTEPLSRNPDERGRLTRGQFIKAGAGLVLLGGGAFGLTRVLDGGDGSSPGATGAVRVFRSRPDLRPPALSADPGPAVDGAGRYVLMGPDSKGNAAQKGPLIAELNGEPVWFKPLPTGTRAMNVAVQRLHGEPVLTWWEGAVYEGYGQGQGVIVDQSYRELARIRAGNGRHTDLHEMLLTPEGTVLITCYPPTRRVDLPAVGGSRRHPVQECVIQELDLRSGRVLMEWRSLDQIGVDESYRALEKPYDYLHVNSIEIAPDGHLLISARHTWALYKLHRGTGELIWRLGGKRSDFTLQSGTQFAWQHDARYIESDLVTVFDDGAGDKVKTETQSRALILRVDEAARVVELAHAYSHPTRQLLAVSMGSTRRMPSGNLLIGWGHEPYVSEFSPDGRLLTDLRLPTGAFSYRALSAPWTGTPTERPAIAAGRLGARGANVLYASWNGATKVRYWQVRAGTDPRSLTPLGSVERGGFETAIELEGSHRYASVTALDAGRTPLAQSRVLRV